MTQRDESDTKPDPLAARFMEADEQELAQLLQLIEQELYRRGWMPQRVWSKAPAEAG